MTKYQNGKIYKIVNDVDDDIYIGSTINTLRQRFGGHKTDANNKHPNSKIYAKMNQVGFDHFRIVLIKKYPCETKDDLTAKEQYYIEKYKPILNMCSAYTGLAKDEYLKRYYTEHKKEMNKQSKHNHMKNKEKIEANKNKKCVCLCGRTHTHTNRARHEQTKRHTKLLSQEILKTINQMKESVDRDKMEWDYSVKQIQ